MRSTFAIAAFAAFLAVGVPARAQDRTALMASTGKALEDQLACLAPAKLGLAFRAMLRNGLIEETDFGSDGIPEFRSKGGLAVFGKRVLLLSGWQEEGDRVLKPFYRAPGTAPPRFIAMTVDAAPADVPFRTHQGQQVPGVPFGPSSSIEAANENYMKRGTTITCSGG
jgi:hypothetical protein